MALNASSSSTACGKSSAIPSIVAIWKASLFARHGDPLMMGAMAIILFPKLALGLSGFETGVAVMPLVRGDATDTEEAPLGRIRNTKKLLRTAALIMSALLLGSSFVTAVLIPADAFQPGHPADGRALAYLAHERFGSLVRHDLRHQHHFDSLVRRRVGARRAAQPRPALPAALRHGAGVGAREPAARRHHHRPSRSP